MAPFRQQRRRNSLWDAEVADCVPGGADVRSERGLAANHVKHFWLLERSDQLRSFYKRRFDELPGFGHSAFVCLRGEPDGPINVTSIS
jgi:hypothetical protein